MKKMIILPIIFVMFFSCSARQVILLDDDNSAVVEMHIDGSELMFLYVKDLSLMMGAEEEGFQLFDRLSFEYILGEAEAIHPEVRILSERTAETEFGITDAANAFEDLETSSNPLIRIETIPEGKRLSIHLDRENFFRAARYFPLKNEMLMQTIGPSEEYPLTREEYTDLLIYAFGEYASAEEIETELGLSSIEADITLPGRILHLENAEQLSENQVHLTFPVLEVLTLEEPLDFVVEYAVD